MHTHSSLSKATDFHSTLRSMCVQLHVRLYVGFTRGRVNRAVTHPLTSDVLHTAVSSSNSATGTLRGRANRAVTHPLQPSLATVSSSHSTTRAFGGRANSAITHPLQPSL